jgi:hypothetical protein
MRLHSIPPITSTGSDRRKTKARLDGLAHMSLGRYMSEREQDKRANDNHESWIAGKYARSDFNQKPEKKIVSSSGYANEQKISCIIDMSDDYNENGDFAITLQFIGFEYSDKKFSRIELPNKIRCYFIPVCFREKEAYLYLTTVGDIFEYEVVSYKGNPARFFSDEGYIPELLQTHDSTSMQVELVDNYVRVTYTKNQI